MSTGRPDVVVDTNVFGAELTRRGGAVAGAYAQHVQGRDLFVSFVTVAALRYGARLAGWGDQRLRRLEARLGEAQTVWAGEGLVDAYVSLRQKCTTSGHALGQKQHEADRWSQRPPAGSMCLSSHAMQCFATRRGSR